MADNEWWNDWHEGYLAIILFTSATLIAVLVVILYLKFRKGCPCYEDYVDPNEQYQWNPFPVDIYTSDDEADPLHNPKSPLPPHQRKSHFSSVSGAMTEGGDEEMGRAASPFSSPDAVMSEEALERRNMVTDRAVQLAKWHKYLHRMRGFYSSKVRGGPASLGLQLKGEQSGRLVSPVLVSKVQPGGAASQAKVTKADGEELPPGEDCLKPGDLLLKISTDETRRRYERGDRSALYNDDAWPIFKRIHVMVAVGPMGGTYEGSKVTLWVIRDQAFKDEWNQALDAYTKAGDTDPHFQVTEETAAAETYSFDENPLAVNVDTFHGLFPVIPDDLLLRADVSMVAQSQVSHRIRREQLSELASKAGVGVDTEKFYQFQSSHEKAMEFMSDCFREVDVNQDGKLTLKEMREVHLKLVESMGLPVLSEQNLEEDFEEADLNNDGVLSFDEYIPYLYEQVLEALFRLDDRRMDASMSGSGHGSMRRNVSSRMSSPEHFM